MSTDCYPLLTRLLQEGVNVNASNGERKESALHLACVIGSLDGVKMLSDYGADINQRTIYNETPLWLAVWKGHYDVTKWLIQHNCELDWPSNACGVWAWDYLPVEVAMGTSCWDITKLLLQAGCTWVNKMYFEPEDKGPLEELPLFKFRKEVMLLAKTDIIFFNFLKEFHNPHTLKDICRQQIRRWLGDRIVPSLQWLPLPKVLCKYLYFEF